MRIEICNNVIATVSSPSLPSLLLATNFKFKFLVSLYFLAALKRKINIAGKLDLLRTNYFAPHFFHFLPVHSNHYCIIWHIITSKVESNKWLRFQIKFCRTLTINSSWHTRSCIKLVFILFFFTLHLRFKKIHLNI